MKKLLHPIQNFKYRSKLICLCILVSLLPLSVMGAFCYRKTIDLLKRQELSALESSAVMVSESIEAKVGLFENLLTYLANSQIIAETSSLDSKTPYEQYDYLNYTFDVFLNTTYLQHPEISQITVYTALDNMTHGSQLRPLSDLEQEDWYSPSCVTSRPSWYRNNDGSICVIQDIANPYIRYVQSYSASCIAIRLNENILFGAMEEASENFRIRISSSDQVLYSYCSPSISQEDEQEQWITITDFIEVCSWTLVLEKPSSLVFSSASFMALIILLILIACIILAFAATQVLTHFFVKRIDALHYYMKRIKEGHLDFQIHDDSHDEIGDLTNNLQDMVDEINRLIREDYQTKLELKETQFKALQAQINPHFLYNCLSLINNKALLNNQPEISQMSQLLSVFYRTTLNKGKSETLLQNEIKNIMSYIDIQRLLHDNSFDVMYQIDPSLPQIQVPNLLLQPLVENSIVHGILPNKEKRGQLFITIAQVKNQIHVTIMDNGLGIPEEKLPTLLQTDSAGYGLKNVHERLRLVYGDASGLTINSIPLQSTMVTFQIPL